MAARTKKPISARPPRTPPTIAPMSLLGPDLDALVFEAAAGDTDGVDDDALELSCDESEKLPGEDEGAELEEDDLDEEADEISVDDLVDVLDVDAIDGVVELASAEVNVGSANKIPVPEFAAQSMYI